MRRSLRHGATLSKSHLQRPAAPLLQAAGPRAKPRAPRHVEVAQPARQVAMGSQRKRYCGVLTPGDVLTESRHAIPWHCGDIEGGGLPQPDQLVEGMERDSLLRLALERADDLEGTTVLLPEAYFSLVDGLRASDRMDLYSRADESHCKANHRPHRPTDEDLSVGKIVDTLRSDYPAFFERLPNFEIYDDSIVLELGQPFHGVEALHGKQRYRRAIRALQTLGKAVSDGEVRCRIADGKDYGHAVKVAWECRGTIGICRIYISAISLYSVTAQVPSLSPDGQEKELAPALSHRVHRHAIEFVEIKPSVLRSILLRSWWERQTQMPVLAMGQRW